MHNMISPHISARKAFANIVMDIYKSGKVNGSDASRLLKVKEGNFVKFEKYIYK